jgi:hypothetical protein
MMHSAKKISHLFKERIEYKKMNQVIIFVFSSLLVIISACSDSNLDMKKESVSITNIDSEKELIPVENDEFFADTSEYIIDSTHLGFINKTKIEFTRVNYPDSSKVYLKLFRKENRKWIQTQILSVETSALQELGPTFKDFNNDGFNDILISTGTAARGANEIQTLFIFKPKTMELLWIRNSEQFPNLDYNSKLNCVDALIFTGGLTTLFLKIKKDSLIKFAEVDQRDERIVVTITDTKGITKEIKNIPNIGFSDMARFKSYDPLLE